MLEADRRSRRDSVVVRVVEYTLPRTGDATVYRLVTTILDPGQALAPGLAALYTQRWEIETTLEGLDLDRLSFTRSLRVVRRQVPAQAALSPADSPAH